MGTVPVNTDDLRRLRDMAIRNGTEHDWMTMVLEWCDGATAEIERLRLSRDRLKAIAAQDYGLMFFRQNEIDRLVAVLFKIRRLAMGPEGLPHIAQVAVDAVEGYSEPTDLRGSP